MPLRFTTPRRTPVALDHHRAPPRLAAKEVGRSQDRLVAVQVGVDLPAMKGVIAERDHVDAGGEHLVGDLRRDPQPAGGVLAVDDHERRIDAPAAPAGNRAVCCLPIPPTTSPTNRRLGAPPSRRRTPAGSAILGDGGKTREGPVSETPSPQASEEPTSEEREPAGGAPVGDATAEQTASGVGPRVVVPRWVQLVLLPLALVACGAIAKASGKVAG